MTNLREEIGNAFLAWSSMVTGEQREVLSPEIDSLLDMMEGIVKKSNKELLARVRDQVKGVAIDMGPQAYSHIRQALDKLEKEL